jgi:Tat protein secretion system quality control protein TatD with DNase activity
MTTIEWLQAKLWENNMLTSEDLKLFDQAKEMEKKDIIMAYKAGLHPCSDEDAEQYYNETFKQQEQ